METARLMIEDPLFESLHGALTFAFRYSGQQYSPSLMATMMRGPIASGRGISGLDGAAQAGIIRALIDRLDPYERQMIAARFEADQGARLSAMLSFMPVVIASMPTGVHSRRAADILIQKWFWGKMKIQDVAVILGCHRNTATPMWVATKRTLDSIWERAEEAAYQELRTAGIIP